MFYFYFENDTFILLHHFRKISQKTPRREIDKAKAERDHYLSKKEAENLAAIVGAMIEQRNTLGISQRELAAICGIPQSSVARIESFKTTPNLDTLLKIF